MPTTFAVQAHSNAGDVRVAGLDGPLDLSSSAGDVIADSLASTEVRAQSSAGSVDVAFKIEPHHVEARSSAGPVTVIVPPGGAAYRVDAHTSAGSTKVNVRTDPQSDRVIVADSSAGDVTVRSG
ncbi:MAG TPA: DUF4097 family beta strand repeat-containing protein [Acidimicrobiales bacterium]|nr:DUF4097 family beta strand repeat-containing protein [Acidimicrobiales bacterium]